MNRVASQFDWRDVAIVAIKGVHSSIFLLNATSLITLDAGGAFSPRLLSQSFSS